MYCTIRPMRKEDIPQVTGIDREAFSTQWPPANYNQELQNQLARYIVACSDTPTAEEPDTETARKHSNSLISRLTHWFKFGFFHNLESPAPEEQDIIGFAGIWVLSDEAHVTNIAVTNKCQRQGIGELLLIRITELARELKADIMTLEVRSSNTTAQSLYLKYGFVQVGIRRAYYTDNREDGVLMSTENINSDSYQALFQQLKQAHEQKWRNQPPAG